MHRPTDGVERYIYVRKHGHKEIRRMSKAMYEQDVERILVTAEEIDAITTRIAEEIAFIQPQSSSRLPPNVLHSLPRKNFR